MSVSAVSVFSLPSTTALIRLGLEEDLSLGDLVSDAVFAPEQISSAVIIARQRLIACGLPVVAEIAKVAGSSIRAQIAVAEGTEVENDGVLIRLKGPTAELLKLERLMLNFLQRMSGIATLANLWAKAANGITVLDTRKTLPGYRALDKYATRVGGVMNHRMNLGSMAMVKNNHVDGVKDGSPAQAIGKIAKLVRRAAPLATPLEIEVRDLKELRAAISARADVIMLDNMSEGELAGAFKLLRSRRFSGIVEVSGGISIERLPALKKLGVRCVSVGSLTHSVKAADISLRIV
jgi:nicotinate-nucleotide pyrophosphorylase (carboxylating)